MAPLGLDSIKIAEMFWKKTRITVSTTAAEVTVAVGNFQADEGQVPTVAAEARAAAESTPTSDSS